MRFRHEARIERYRALRVAANGGRSPVRQRVFFRPAGSRRGRTSWRLMIVSQPREADGQRRMTAVPFDVDAQTKAPIA
jgi:hypothetical protein